MKRGATPSITRPAASFATAWKRTTSPCFASLTDGVISTEATGVASTSTAVEARALPAAAVSVARPAASAWIRPSDSTRTTPGALLDQTIATAKTFDLRFTPDSHPEAGYFFRSDHFPFAKRGVPAISYGSGNDWVDGGVAAAEADQAKYTEERYHQPADQWEASWTFAGMAHDLGMLYTLGRDLANSNDWPNWSQDSEFRGARDQTAADRR